MTKKIILIIFAGSLCFFLVAYDKGRKPEKEDDRYCAKMKDGVMKVVHEGEVITMDVLLADGTQVKTDGNIIKKDGTRITLKEGECIDKSGQLSSQPAKEKNKN